MVRKAGWIALFLLVIGGMIFLSLAQRVTLTALERLQIDDRAAIGDSIVTHIGEVEPGTRLPVTECLDTKSDFLFAVELPDRRTGYVNIGKIKVEVNPIWSELSGPYAFDCPATHS